MTDEINYSNNSAYIPVHKHRRSMIRLAVIITAVVIVVGGFVVFNIFRIHSNGRIALREGKNIRLALVATDIELYPSGGNIFSPERANGLTPGVMESVKRLADVNGDLMLVAYDRNNREIRKLTYNTGDYLVTYESDGIKEYWTVDYLWKILDY
jgi:hypothetical protein